MCLLALPLRLFPALPPPLAAAWAAAAGGFRPAAEGSIDLSCCFFDAATLILICIGGTSGAAPFTNRASAACSALRFSAELWSTSRRVALWLRVSSPPPSAAAAGDPEDAPSRAFFRKSSCSAMGTSSSNPPVFRALALTRCLFCAVRSAGGDACGSRAAAVAARGGATLAVGLLLLPGSAAMSFDSLPAFSRSPTGSLQGHGNP